jgi:hypothetical protein
MNSLNPLISSGFSLDAWVECSLPLHRHSYIGFILAFASSIHNKQQNRFQTGGWKNWWVQKSELVGQEFLSGVCVLEVIVVPSMLRLTRKTTTLVRVLPTFAFSDGEKDSRRKWKSPLVD